MSLALISMASPLSLFLLPCQVETNTKRISSLPILSPSPNQYKKYCEPSVKRILIKYLLMAWHVVRPLAFLLFAYLVLSYFDFPSHSTADPSLNLTSSHKPIMSALDAKQQKRARFQRVFDTIRDELVEHMRSENMPQEAVEWYKRNLDYNVPGGKLNRGLSVVDSVEILRGRSLSDDEYFKSALLGWLIEFVSDYRFRLR
ncbi:hypothetical protein EV401DRAFT_1330726 [Pisolithus croceorrhizus]|nr:hypothetical protein EV401DRAFT_1330726 [Pisolithus croceorrhizus]